MNDPTARGVSFGKRNPRPAILHGNCKKLLGKIRRPGIDRYPAQKKKETSFEVKVRRWCKRVYEQSCNAARRKFAYRQWKKYS